MYKPTGNPVGRKPRANIDWEAIQAEYEAGTKSLREISEPRGLSETAIRKRARRDGWQRDLSAKIRKAADRELVRREVRKASFEATEPEIIKAASATRADISERQRERIATVAALADAVMKRVRDLKLDQEVTNLGSASAAVKVVDMAATAAGKLIALERHIWNMDAPVEAGDAKSNACDDLMKRLAKLSEKG
jgi:hypothetical protein